MTFPIKTVVVVVALGTTAAFAYAPLKAYWIARNRPEFRTSTVTRGSIVATVESTGTVDPVLKVQIGSFVSGPVVELCVDFNDRVQQGDLLARIDPRIYKAAVARDEASLAHAKAEVARVTALRQQAINDEKRAMALREANEDYLADTELDRFKFNRLSLEAQLLIAKATIDQADANLENSRANLGYTEIRSPVDGIIIDRKIDPGQTLAAQFQTPELFIVAPNMEEQMNILAAVDEADIGLLHDAQERGTAVRFTVDAYDDVFEGKISQIRMNPTTEQTVVTYPVVVEAENPELKLLPGMTANLIFEVDSRQDVLRVPNAALRYYPEREHVRPQDRVLLDGPDTEDDSPVASASLESESASGAGSVAKQRNRRHVWVHEGEYLKAVEIITGISDHKYTELVSGQITENMLLVIGIRSPSQ